MSMSDTKLKFPFGEIFEMAGNQHLAPSPKKNHRRRRRSGPATRKACHQLKKQFTWLKMNSPERDHPIQGSTIILIWEIKHHSWMKSFNYGC